MSKKTFKTYKEKSNTTIIYSKSPILKPFSTTVFIGLVLIIVLYTAIDQSHIMDKYSQLVWYQPLFFVIGLMFCIYRGLKFLQKIRFRHGANDPFLAKVLMENYLRKICGDIDAKLNSLTLTSANILTDILKDKIIEIYDSDCRRFPRIRKQIEKAALKESNGRVFNIFFTTNKEYQNKPLPSEIRLISDTIRRKRKDLTEHLDVLERSHKNLVTFLDNYLDLWPVDKEKIDLILKTYHYRPPGKNQVRRMAFAIQTAAHLSKFLNNKLNSKEQHDYEVMADEIISDLANAILKHKTAWTQVIRGYENPRGNTL